MSQVLAIGIRYPGTDAPWVEIIDGKVIIHPGNQLHSFDIRHGEDATHVELVDGKWVVVGGQKPPPGF